MKQIRRERSKTLVDDLEKWLREERRKLSSKNALASDGLQPEAMTAMTRFLDDGRICMSNNAAEHAVRGIAQRLARRAHQRLCNRLLASVNAQMTSQDDP